MHSSIAFQKDTGRSWIARQWIPLDVSRLYPLNAKVKWSCKIQKWSHLTPKSISMNDTVRIVHKTSTNCYPILNRNSKKWRTTASSSVWYFLTFTNSLVYYAVPMRIDVFWCHSHDNRPFAGSCQSVLFLSFMMSSSFLKLFSFACTHVKSSIAAFFRQQLRSDDRQDPAKWITRYEWMTLVMNNYEVLIRDGISRYICSWSAMFQSMRMYRWNSHWIIDETPSLTWINPLSEP